MKAVYLIVASLGFVLMSVQTPAQEARPPVPPAPMSAPAPIAITGTDGPLSCAYCDLRGKDLSGKNLSNANLVGSDLRGAKLVGATLDGAILVGANLAGADLSGARLGSTSKGPADLTNANLTGAKFHQTVLIGAQLPFAALEGADFSGADLTGSVLGPHPKVGTAGGQRTSFRGARMDRRNDTAEMEADLSGVIWNEAKAEAAAAGPAGVTCGNSILSAVTDPVFVSTQGTDSANCGASLTTACKSLAHALSRCTPQSCNVLAMFGEYVLPATLAFNSQTAPAGARLVGGCVPSGQAEAGLTSLISAPPGGAPAVSVDRVKPVALENFKVLGSTATGIIAAPAVTVQIANAPEVVFTNSMVVGGKGGAGASGAAQPTGTKGGDASGQTAGVNTSCANVNGGAGANKMIANWSGEVYPHAEFSCDGGCNGAPGSPGITSNGAGGGPNGGSFEAGWCPPITPNDGHRGASGNNADCGTGGTASTNLVGAFNGTTWSPGAGAAGKRGGDAGGGGGGGAGGGVWGICFIKFDYEGSSGGGAGAGGCGGPPGPDGQQGGASFAIVAAAGSVVTLNQSRVVAGGGGAGGAGGGGGNGGGPGAGATGAGTSGFGYHGGKGGDGNSGGTGGGGGGGAGGNGGPSAAVALVGGAKIDGTGIYYVGSSGNFGGGGAGGTSPVCSTGPGGTSGVFGSVAETLTYP